MFLEFLHCWCHIYSSRHLLKSLLPSVGLLIIGAAVNRGFLGFWMGRIIPLLSLSLVAEFLIFYILSSYNSLGWLLETSFSRKWCYNSSWFHPWPPTRSIFLRTLQLLDLLSLLHLGRYTRIWPEWEAVWVWHVGLWGYPQTRWGNWDIPKGFWAYFLMKSWSRHQEPCSFNVLWYSYPFPLLAFPSPP